MLGTLREKGGCFAPAERIRFSVTGEDRLRYLNGQVSNDLRKLVPKAAMQACVLSAKGKLEGVIWIWSEPDRLVVECDAALGEPLAPRLEKYVVADDVTIGPLEFEPEIHVFGPASRLIEESRVLRRISRMGVDGADLAAAGALEACQELDLAEAPPEALELLRIERGLPRWGRELGPETLPAEAGLDATAVDFHKGCYIGQEVVSRIRSVGHANRTLHTFAVVEGALPHPGAELFAPGAAGRAAGVVTSAAHHFELSKGVGLCYIRRGVDSESALETAPGPGFSRIKLCHLPCESSLRS